jgi:hypothetical protein
MKLSVFGSTGVETSRLYPFTPITPRPLTIPFPLPHTPVPRYLHTVFPPLPPDRRNCYISANEERTQERIFGETGSLLDMVSLFTIQYDYLPEVKEPIHDRRKRKMISRLRTVVHQPAPKERRKSLRNLKLDRVLRRGRFLSRQKPVIPATPSRLTFQHLFFPCSVRHLFS